MAIRGLLAVWVQDARRTNCTSRRELTGGPPVPAHRDTSRRKCPHVRCTPSAPLRLHAHPEQIAHPLLRGLVAQLALTQVRVGNEEASAARLCGVILVPHEEDAMIRARAHGRPAREDGFDV